MCPDQHRLCSVWGWAQGQLEAVPGAHQLLSCGEGIKESPDTSVADGNHTKNLCQEELLDFITYKPPLFIQLPSENIRNYQ